MVSARTGNFVHKFAFVDILDAGRFRMNLNVMDPKVIVLAALVILIIAVLAWLYVRKRRSTTADLRQKFGPE